MCGTVARGERQARHQVLTCANCGGKVFVLPLSPFTEDGTSKSPVRQERKEGTAPPRFWLWPALAASATLAVVLVLGIMFFRGKAHDKHVSLRPEYDRCVLAGQRALSTGKFVLAATELQQALDLQQAHSELHSLSERRHLTSLYRQAELLSELSAEPIEDILRHAAELLPLDPLEWKSIFGQRYQRRGIVFDTEVRRDGHGAYHTDYAVFFRGKRHIVDLGRVSAFDAIPWQVPQRLVFGIRLEEIDPAAEGIWTIRFDPHSAVLLTDVGSACAVSGQPEEELRPVVQRQAAWTAALP
jgi:hypothetical protein